MGRMMNGLDPRDLPTPPGCDRDAMVSDQLPIIPPPSAFLRRCEPPLGQLLGSFKPKRRKSVKAVEKYIDGNWKTNMTLLHMRWEAKKEWNTDPRYPEDAENQHLRLTSMEGEPLTILTHVMGPFSQTPVPGVDVLDVSGVDAVHPLRQIGVAPWTAEFTTLLGIWTRLMPFGFAVALGASVGPDQVHCCSVTFPAFTLPPSTRLRVPHFVLVFYKASLGPVPQNLRKVLLDDEMGDASGRAKETRTEGVHVVTTFSYVTDTRTASFWMRRDVADALSSADSDHRVSIWRTDSWREQVSGVPARGNLAEGQSWAEVLKEP